MAIRLRCPSCNAKLSVADRKAGMTINCPGCRTPVEVPGAVAQTAAAPARETDWDDELPDEDEGFQVRSPETEMEGMDLTPMVDVTFLLLIFFMITASFSIQKVLPFPAPDPDKESASQTVRNLEEFEENSIIVHVDENNRLSVDEKPLADASLLLDTIDRIKAEDRDRKKTDLVIVSHYHAHHEMTVFVIDVATSAGIQKIRIGTQPGTAPKR